MPEIGDLILFGRAFRLGAGMRLIVWTIAALLAGAGQSRADGFDIRVGQQLLDNCQSSEAMAISSCRNYVSGALEAVLMIQAQTFVCHFLLPDQWTEEQAIATVVDYQGAPRQTGGGGREGDHGCCGRRVSVSEVDDLFRDHPRKPFCRAAGQRPAEAAVAGVEI